MAVNGATIMGRESDERRSATLLPTTVDTSSLTSVYNSLPEPSSRELTLRSSRDITDLGPRHLRQFNVPQYVGSSSSSTTSSVSSEDAMNMRFTDLTHMHLKKSIDQIYGSYSSADSDHSDRQTPRQVFSSSNSTYGSGSGGVSSARDYLSFNRVSATESAQRQHLSSLTSQSIGNGYSSQSSRLPPSIANSTNTSSKFHSLLSVKDALLEEKESAIVKLRLQVSSLQHQVKDSNATLRQVMQNKQNNITRSMSSLAIDTCSQNGDLSQSETEYEAAKMRVRLAESFSQQEKNVNDLQSLLGKTECQLAETKSQNAREKRILEDKVKELEFCLRTRDKTISELKRKHKSLSDRIEKYKRRVESLERYLGDLPTMEESKEIKRTMDYLSNDKEKLAGDLDHIRNKYDEANAILREKEECLRIETEKNALLEEEIEALSKKITEFENSQEELGVTERREFDDTRRELDQMHRDREDAAKLLAAADMRIKSLTTQHRSDIAKLEERIEQEENATQTLKRELSAKQHTSSKVQSAMTKLASQNQQLMEEKMSFLEQLRTLESERSSSRDAARVASRLQRETQIAVRDLEAVTQVLLQTSRGDDPNLSALLGVRPSSVGLTEEEMDERDAGASLTVEQMTKRLTDVRKLRRDIDELRSTLSNRYAENIGQNCATQ
ncbi:centrosomal protein of 85 kDa-like [Styela clava]